MSFTRGGPTKRKQFEWHYDLQTCQLIVINQNGRELMYSLEEIQRILSAICQRFSSDYFPLSNNAAYSGDGTGKPSLGSILLEQLTNDINRAQGASYLGVVLEETGYFQWNAKTFGIAWQLLDVDFSEAALAKRLSL